ncbi:hypothetical protein FQN54_001056 [Arachnomyces sp. PD_36]|nr:hypothetical protein FQN54_001056 [Arachnomyces sp. PD_36]
MVYNLSLILTLLASASASPIVEVSRRTTTPLSYAAFGDSFAAGIGAGNFYTGSEDERDNVCARMSGSYPSRTKDFLSSRMSAVDFAACSGDVLDNIDEQVNTLLGNQVDVASLSISGNDFGFGNVVQMCVYPHKWMKNKPDNPREACNNALNDAENAINDESVWEKYRSKVELIRDSVVDGGSIYITGYAKFFSPEGNSKDQCHNNHFFNSSLGRFIYLLKMNWETRAWMNQLVDTVNSRIQADVVEPLGGSDSNIHFIDIDPQFNGKRFCELDKNPWGEGPDDVWFHDLFSELDEADDFRFRGISDKLQQNSVFHPKKIAHEATAHLLTYHIISENLSGEDLITGPDQICIGFGPGGGNTCFEVPAGCVAADPVDNSVPVVVCEDGTAVESVQ